jgi:hypothetical protein
MPETTWIIDAKSGGVTAEGMTLKTVPRALS